MKKEIPLSVPHLNMNILDNLKECIETGWVSTSGRFISEFEKKLADYVGTDDAVAVQNGAAGLHLALDILGVKAGDEVIVPALTFVAAINPVSYIGAEPVFLDCGDGFCLDPDKLEKFCAINCTLTEEGLINNLTKKKIGAIIVVHVFGNMAHMERILKTARKYGLKIIEDATEALGTYYKEGPYSGRFAGTMGDIGVYSFNANKIITSGGGGMMVSENKSYLDRARYLSATAKDDDIYFIHNEVGYNYRMLNIQASFGVSQMDEIESFIATKEKNYNLYKELLGETEGVTLMPFNRQVRPNYWFYPVYVDKSKYGADRDTLMRKLIGEGVQCRPVWKLINTQKPYLSARSVDIEKARDYESNVLTVPCSVNLSAEQIKYVCDIIRDKQ